jgi:hypothetical protein
VSDGVNPHEIVNYWIVCCCYHAAFSLAASTSKEKARLFTKEVRMARIGITTYACAGFKALTIMNLMGHKDLKDDDAIHSCRPTSETSACSEFCPQIGHTRETAANAGGRKYLILLVGARGFEPPTSRSRTKGSAKT